MPLHRHCQGEAHTYVIVTKGGKPVKKGRGLGVWFTPVGTAISEVPVNDQSVPVSFKARTSDFQDVSIGGQVWYTVSEPEKIAQRFDFSLDTETGTVAWLSFEGAETVQLGEPLVRPLEQLSARPDWIPG